MNPGVMLPETVLEGATQKQLAVFSKQKRFNYKLIFVSEA